MSNKLLELRINKEFIDSNFEGYKLSLDEIPSINYKLPFGVRKLQQAGDNFSYLYVTLFNMQNHLIIDPWNKNTLYYINENFKIAKIVLDVKGNIIENMEEVLQIPQQEIKQEYHYNANMVLASSDTVVVSDGSTFLHIINTKKRLDSTDWTIEYSSEIINENHQFILLDARCVQQNEFTQLHCLLTAIVENKENETLKTSKSYTKLFWITLQKSNSANWKVEDTLEIKTAGAVRYGYFTSNCEYLCIESTKSVSLLKQDEEVEVDKIPEDCKYYWQQNIDDIKIWFLLSEKCVKEEVKINISDQHINVVIKTKKMLCGDLFQRVNSDLTTWNYKDNRLEIILSKYEEGQMWYYLVKDNDKGEEVSDPAVVNEIHERLSHLCSDEAMTDDTIPMFNPGQLEACDNVSDEDSRLFAIDRRTKKIVKEINLNGRQKLFNVRLKETEPPCLCVRHDVDGTLWSFEFNDENLCKHAGTLNAFGYVLASKEWKYCTCSPDLSYAVIATTKQILFIYKQNCIVNTELRNRKTGHTFSKIGKQYLITLNTPDEILGIHASDDFLIVLTKWYVHIYWIKNV